MIEWLGEQLDIKSLEDWYRVSLSHIRRKWGTIKSSKDLSDRLQLAYPHHQWKTDIFSRSTYHPKSSQRDLIRAIRQIFPNNGLLIGQLIFEGVEEDYGHSDLVLPSGHKMELDVYIETLALGFEYQGEQHFKPVYWTGIDFESRRNKDEEKRRLCRQVLIIEFILLF